MIKEFSRAQRVAREMLKKIAVILQCKIKDPRVGTMITVSNVIISRNLTHAKVFITYLNEQNEDEDIVKNNLKALKKASGFIRFLLSKVMHLRIIPELTFFHDNSLVEGIRMSRLVTSIVKRDDERHIEEQKRQ